MTKLMILPLVTGHRTATCTICDQKAERAVLTDDSCPVMEALCLACATAATDFNDDNLTWEELADAIREERGWAEPTEDESMDGDLETALASAGLGTDEDYRYPDVDELESDLLDQ